jgi:streptomycin 6-kinase
VTRTEDAAALIPAAFRESIRGWSAEQGRVGGPSGAQWSDRLPRLLAQVLDDWDLTPVGVGRTGYSAVVVPVTRAGQPLCLKVAWPHLEGRDEALALRLWDGRGAVRLVAADPARGALLLEALDADRDLRAVDIDTACQVAGSLLAQLNVPAPGGLRPLSEYAREQVGRLATTGGVPRRFAERAGGLVRDLTADPDCDSTLLHTDLHFENILATLPGTGRPEWVAIDPHTMAGHPGFELQPLVRNREDELGTGSAFRYLVRRRVEIAAEAAGIDEDLALGWTYVHTAMQARWAAEGDEHDLLTFNLALLKALDG